MKICVVFIVITVSIVFVMATEPAPVAVDPEEPCTKAGGVCAKGCPGGPYNKGLCPKQQKNGVECCYAPVEHQCRTSGGECIVDCPPLIAFDRGCPNGKKCCIWLR